MVPNGTATGLDIGLSNFSLSLITLSFYTMCKSTTPIFLLAFCFLWRIERRAPAAPPGAPAAPGRVSQQACADAGGGPPRRPSWGLAGVVGVISAGLALLVAGETEFDGLGFALVMAASALSGLRWTITQLQLQGSDGHGARLPAPARPDARMPVSVLRGAVSAVAEGPAPRARLVGRAGGGASVVDAGCARRLHTPGCRAPRAPGSCRPAAHPDPAPTAARRLRAQ